MNNFQQYTLLTFMKIERYELEIGITMFSFNLSASPLFFLLMVTLCFQNINCIKDMQFMNAMK